MCFMESGVGVGQANRMEDVRVVQTLLSMNVASLGTFAAAPEITGHLDSRTIQALTLWQRYVRQTAPPQESAKLAERLPAIVPRGYSYRRLCEGALLGHPLGRLGRSDRALVEQACSPAKQLAFGTFCFVVDSRCRPDYRKLRFIHSLAPTARKVQARWRVPTSVLMAQAAVESYWGTRAIDNAYFGIKGKAPSGKSTSFGTTEVIGGKTIHIKDEFRAYRDVEEAADDYGRFLNENRRYKGCFSHTDDPIAFVEELARAGYATSPVYAKTVTDIIRQYQLHIYDH